MPPAARCDPPWATETEDRDGRFWSVVFSFSLKGTRGGLVGWGEIGEKRGVKPKDGSFGKKNHEGVFDCVYLILNSGVFCLRC